MQIDIPKEELERLYWKEGLSTLKIADELSVCKRTVINKMNLFGIKRRDSSVSHIISLSLSCDINSHSFAYLLGVYYGDGSSNDRCFRVAVKDKDFILNVQSHIVSLGFPKYKITKRVNNSSFIWDVNVSRKLFVNLLNKDFDLFSFKKKWISYFLMGMFDSEGCVKKNKCVTLSNNNISLLRECSDLLKIFNIDSKIGKGYIGSLGFKSNNPIYEMYITHRRNLVPFHKYFHFSIKRKQDRLDAIVKSYK